ncbi:MAG TPA: nucleotidyltransferase family protein [Gemmataceae bacterium]|nr:nucleotidyltransferase family protein [Gemmataceae bacterium]
MTFALLPAAGKSSRMGRPKLALPLRGVTVLECTVTALRQAGADPVLVVLGPQVPELAPLARRAGALVLQLPAETPDMRATVEAGLDWLEGQYRPAPEAGWLLCPADHPVLDPAVVRQLVEARDANPGRSVFIPTWNGRRGHPTLLAWHHVGPMRALPAGLGLNAYLRQQGAVTAEVPVSSPGVLYDLDTPADYERLRAGGD